MPSHPFAPNGYFNALSGERRKQILSSDFGRSLLLSGLEYALPLWWVFKDQTNGLTLRNGSSFLVNRGHGIFAVTAAHVLAEYVATKSRSTKIACQLGSLEFDPEARLISRQDKLDIATFRVTEVEAAHINKAIVPSEPPIWEPLVPTLTNFAFFAGFPAQSGGLTPSGDFATAPHFAMQPITSVTDHQIGCRFDREKMIDLSGQGLPPQGYDVGGISGGPLLMPTLVRQEDVEGVIWRLAGIIVQAAMGELFEQIVAVRSNYIQSDGKIG
ncbi:MAG: hypothetical protein WBD53_09395 [Xanthobacteraceae bacterium]